MGEDSDVFVGLDVAKVRYAVAVAEGGRRGGVRFLGEISAEPMSVRRLVARLERRHARLHFCYEAGPTGYGLYRQLTGMGYRCTVVAPRLTPPCPRTSSAPAVDLRGRTAKLNLHASFLQISDQMLVGISYCYITVGIVGLSCKVT